MEELWRQTVAGYLDNPLPMLFKEKLAALLGRYCSVPYCLICHSASLAPMGMTATEVLQLLEGEPPDIEALASATADFQPLTASQWPASGSPLEKTLLDCSVAIFLKEHAEGHHASLLYILGQVAKLVQQKQTAEKRLVDQQNDLLRASEARFRLITEVMLHLIWLTDAEGQCIFLNDRYEQFVGKKADDLIGPSWSALIHPKDRDAMQSSWDHAMANGTDYHAEYRLQNNGDTYRWMLSRAIALRDEQGTVLQSLGTCKDVDEHKRTLSELSLERDMRDRFVAAMTHDLRSPLTAVKLRAELSMRRAATEESLKASMVKIIAQVKRADTMIQDLLDANSLRFGQSLPIKVAVCDLAEVVRLTVSDLTDLHGDRVITHLPDAPVLGNWDAHALRRALENLLTNAVKYGAADRPIHVVLESSIDTIAVSVKNEGPALSEAEQGVIFDPFERTSTA